MRIVLGLLLLIFLGAIGLFAFQNQGTVEVHFANRILTAPLALLSIGIYLLGMISGWSVVAFLRRSIARVTTEPRSREV
jgi:putative membrane protein